MMLSRFRRPFGFALAAGLALLLLPDPARGQAIIKVNDTINFRVGFQLQGWADWNQDQISQGYTQSMFIRRVRFILAGNFAKNVSFFFQTDNPNLGKTSLPASSPKVLNTGFLTQDAFMEWHPFTNDQFIIDFGKMLMPFTRNSLQSTSSHLSWDGGTFTFLQGAGTQSDAGRDVGLQMKTYLVNDHLEFRAGVFDGFRGPTTTDPVTKGADAGSRNSYRFAGRVVYNFLDPEPKGYVPVGTWLGKKTIFAIGGGYDTQSTYKAYGADLMVDLPFGPGDAKVGRDALTAHVDFIHYDGGCGLNAAGTAHVTTCLIPTLFEQNEVFTDLGWFFHAINLQPFVRYEMDEFKESIDKGRGSHRYGGGFNYYVTPAAQQMKITVGYERIVPKTAPTTAGSTKDTNHFLVQLQIVYF